MKRITTILIFVLFAGCGGEANNSNEKNTASGKASGADKDGAAGQSGQAPVVKKGTPAEQTQSGDQAGNRVRTTSFFGAARLTSDLNMLKQVALAIHNYHDVTRSFAMFPAGINGAPANKKLSWRVKILPFLDLSNLHDRFEPDQPWDSAKNKPLIEEGIKPFTLSNGNLISAIKHEKEPKAFRDIRDGMSNTIMLIENPHADGKDWSQPTDLSIENAVKLLKSLKKGEFVIAATYDGAVHKLYSPEGKGLADKELAALFDYDDGEPINERIFEPSK